MKRYTEKKAAAACNRLLSSAQRAHCTAPSRKSPATFNGWITPDGDFCITDGFRAYKLRRAPEGVQEYLTADRPTKEERDAVQRMHNGVEQYFNPDRVPVTVTRIEAPTIEAIKAGTVTKITPRGRQITFRPAADRPAHYNPRYLSEIVELLPGADYYTDEKNPYAPLYAIAPEGSAVLLPVRVFD